MGRIAFLSRLARAVVGRLQVPPRRQASLEIRKSRHARLAETDRHPPAREKPVPIDGDVLTVRAAAAGVGYVGTARSCYDCFALAAHSSTCEC